MVSSAAADGLGGLDLTCGDWSLYGMLSRLRLDIWTVVEGSPGKA
jgi:hypothetical protein